ncbi:MAG: methylated-DNA--[protein]-cysteine S-methyltransferase [Eubacteriales bacterium]|nr:methylated-DNA--[protein]-cysteine S-methyltransferase [Eubacteriales bacterium]
MQWTHTYHSPLGELMLSSDGTRLTGLWFQQQKYFGSTLSPDAQEGHIPLFDRADAWLDAYFHGENPPLDIPLAPKGSLFQRSVWDILLQIPYGEVTTYGAIAKRLEEQTGKHASAQAVGGAVGHNPISILIPCHRVVGASGSLTGYAAGLDKKIQLLQLEGVATETFFVPKQA